VSNENGWLGADGVPDIFQITITAGIGPGPTALAAFDSALLAAGIANYNLLPLSSVIPRGAKLVQERPSAVDAAWSHRLYLVLAEKRQTKPGTEAWAGLGWVQSDDNGRGLFVEHHGESRQTVELLIEQSLTAIVAARCPEVFGPLNSKIIGITCDSEPVSALVAATYEVEGWRTFRHQHD